MKRLPLRELAQVVAMSGLVLAAARCGDEAPPHALDGDVHFTSRSALLTTNRDALHLCIHETAALRTVGASRVTERLQASLDTVSRTPGFALGRFGSQAPTLEVGCPGPDVAPTRLEPKEAWVGPGLTSRPSRFRTFIHVLDEKTADAVLGERKAERAPAELLRVDDHMLVEVSTALVVRESYLDDPEFAQRWLAWSVGLQPAGGELPGVLGDVVEKSVTDVTAPRLLKPGSEPAK